MSGVEFIAEQLIADSEASGRTFLATWVERCKDACKGTLAEKLLDHLIPAVSSPPEIKKFIDKSIEEFETFVRDNEGCDLVEMHVAMIDLDEKLHRAL